MSWFADWCSYIKESPADRQTCSCWSKRCFPINRINAEECALKAVSPLLRNLRLICIYCLALCCVIRCVVSIPSQVLANRDRCNELMQWGFCSCQWFVDDFKIENSCSLLTNTRVFLSETLWSGFSFNKGLIIPYFIWLTRPTSGITLESDFFQPFIFGKAYRD